MSAQKLSQLRSQSENLARQITRQEMAHDQAKARITQLVQELETQFGVSSMAEAEQLLAAKKEEYNATLAEIEAVLSDAS